MQIKLKIAEKVLNWQYQIIYVLEYYSAIEFKKPYIYIYIYKCPIFFEKNADDEIKRQKITSVLSNSQVIFS